MGAFRSGAEVPQHQHNRDRLRRATSWWQRSKAAASDTDRFIFLWIAFNAAYGVEPPMSDADARPPEREAFVRFCREIVNRDEKKTLYSIFWSKYSGPVRILLDNQFVYGPFWRWVSGLPQGTDWQDQFERDNRRARNYLERGDACGVLEVVLLRLYTLRNQIFHGGATYAAGWGQAQVRDGAALMAEIVPAILDIMRNEIAENPDSEIWGKVLYPRVGEERR